MVFLRASAASPTDPEAAGHADAFPEGRADFPVQTVGRGVAALPAVDFSFHLDCRAAVGLPVAVAFAVVAAELVVGRGQLVRVQAQLL